MCCRCTTLSEALRKSYLAYRDSFKVIGKHVVLDSDVAIAINEVVGRFNCILTDTQYGRAGFLLLVEV